MKNAILVSGCPGEERGWNTQLLYFTGSSLSRDDMEFSYLCVVNP